MNGAPLLSINALTVRFHQDGQTFTAANAVSFEVRYGETVALVGQSGSGKSVTAHAILGLLPSQGVETSGHVVFKGEPLDPQMDKHLREIRGNRVSMIFQEPMTALNPLHTVLAQVAEVIRTHQVRTEADLERDALALLEAVELPTPTLIARKYPHELSGGQRQRVMIAMALANNPDLLIADEPTTALDVTVQKQILELLKRLQRERGMSLLLITHDLGVVRHYADRVLVMKTGEIVEGNESHRLFSAPQHPYTRDLLASEPPPKSPRLSTESSTALSCINLKVWFPIRRGIFRRIVDHVRAVNGVSVTLRKGETLGIVGESGSGKSTLAQAILRLIPSEGQITIGTDEISQWHGKQLLPLRKRIQVVFQDPFASLSPRLTVGDIIAEGVEIHSRKTREEIARIVDSALRDVGLEPPMQSRYPHEFSGGQRQRIAIARALALAPDIVILDEPTSALDRAVQVQILELLAKLQRERQLTYIFISHDLKVIRAIADEILVMKNGHVVEHGPTEAIFTRPSDPYTRQLLDATLI